MSVRLDEVDLGDLALGEEFAGAGVRSQVERTLGGREVVWEQAVNSRPLDLAGGDDWGWLSRETLLRLRAMADVPGAAYSLDLGGEARTVRFRHEEPPVLSAEAVRPGPHPAPDAPYCRVRLRLVELLA